VAIIEGRNLSRVFGTGETAVHALRGVSLQVEPGEFVSVLGPSGAGKSTLLHLLGGLDTPTEGSVTVDGTDLSRLSENALTIFRRKRAGFVFQSLNLLPTLTVYENIAVPLLLDNRRTKEDRDRVEDLIELFGLRGRENRRAPELSAGEQQRVAIARAIVAEPAIIIADEPTGAVDTRTGEEIIQLLWESSDNFHQTVLVVTHHPRVAVVADRVLFLKDGEIISELTLGRRDNHTDARPVIARLEELGL